MPEMTSDEPDYETVSEPEDAREILPLVAALF
jgi:hypothetical protein